jgi:CRP-like cAMP-binding protein
MQIEDIARRLSRTTFFRALAPDHLARIAAIARSVALPAGHALFQEGDEPDGLYCVVDGVVRIFITHADGRELTINLMEEGDVIGEIALLDDLPRSAHAAALTDTALVLVPRGAFDALLAEEPALYRPIVLALCERLRHATDQLTRNAFSDLRQRLTLLLRELAIVHGRIEPDIAVVDLDLTQGMLAQMLGVTREAVNKQLRVMQREGRLRIEAGRIAVVRDRPAA